jgi:hypothetical protein
MPPEASNRNSCRTSGVILTCYVDGHKWFRSVPVTEETTGQGSGSLDCDADARSRDAARFALPVRRNRRAN